MITTPHFLIPNCIPISSLKICTVCTMELFWSLPLANNFRSSMNNKWFNLNALLPLSEPTFALLDTNVNGTMCKTNSMDKLLPWKIPLLISNSSNFLFDAFSHNFHDFMLFLKKSHTLFAIQITSKTHKSKYGVPSQKRFCSLLIP